MGRGDKRSAQGKIRRGSYGKTRPKMRNKLKMKAKRAKAAAR